ncbi:hypothetical protein D9613_001403 [Agrocybe pediades]|uniref:Uncharacterized protein n=1 Tax=Agrocybe pediades TaxID=84607 RepID=A0A8H4R4N8_9AGAR|nr:hypothetical protein D9613_001403 [Agrocybe pediades]
MNREYRTKKIVELSEEELINLGFLGDNTLAGVRAIVQKVRADPERLGPVACFQVDCLKRKYTPQPRAQGAAGSPPASPTSPTSPFVNKTDTLSSRLRNKESAAHTVVPPDLISPFEKRFWYHGISNDPPQILYRSDLETNHFPTQQPGERFFRVPTKTAYGVFGTRLNEVWDTVAPQIRDSVKARGLKYSAIKAARFSTVDEAYGEEIFGPVVVWIVVPPNTANAEAVRDATPDILNILNDAQVTGVVVEWYEGTVERLGGPPLMIIEDNISPTFGLNHPFDVGLGIPIARASDDAQGTITLLFREVKTSNGDPSNTILALTNKHVVSLDTTTDYDFDPANPQSILVCGEHRFDRAFNEIEDAVNEGFRDAVDLTRYLKDLESKSCGQITELIQHKRTVLDYKHEDNATLQEFFDEVNEKWRDANNRKLGQVHWAPHISVKVDDHHYTRDIATLVVDEEKLKNFTGNVVDLGNQYTGNLHTSTQLNYRFWPVDAIRKNRSIPGNNLQLPIRRALPRHLPINPDTQTKDGEPLYVVGKYGNTSELTFGNYSSMHAYICTESGLESREVVVYNSGTEKRPADDFSAKGDSGSLIFNGDGDGLAILHSGMPRGEDNHVSYATPLWWVLEQVLERYPYAEFYGMEYQP